MKVGIDLGTTYSTIARYDGISSKAEIIPNVFGKDLTPSVICFLEDETIIGDEAKDMQAGGTGAVASVFKRRMGDPDYVFEAFGRTYDACDLSAILLKKLISDAEKRTGEKIDGAVITVPAYFNDLQRKATIRAGEACGIGVMKIVNEPTAAAVYYGYRHSNGKTVLVYDLGGGTFDVTVVRVEGGKIDVVGTAGNHLLGGKDWDAVLVDEACKRFSDEFGEDPREDVSVMNEMAVAAEDYKKLLSKAGEVSVTVRYDGNVGRYRITRDEFDSKTRFLLKATKDVIDGLFEDIGMDFSDIDEILLCGGSTRMPQVAEYLRVLTDTDVITHTDTDLAVAKGAAMMADYYERGTDADGMEISDVTSHSLGALSVNGDGTRYINKIIIPANSKVPCSMTRPFMIDGGNMTDRIEVYTLQGESEIPLDCTVLEKNVVTGFDNDGDGAVIDIEYMYGGDGTVRVRAFQNGRPVTVSTEPVPEDVSWMAGAPGNHTTEMPITSNIVVCIDLSRSMKESMAEVKDVVRDFIHGISGCDTRIGLIGFGDRVQVFKDLTVDTSAVMSSLNDLKVNMLGRGTDRSPLRAAMDMLMETKGARTAVVLSDGEWGRRDNAMDEAEACRRNGIGVVAVGFGDNVEMSFLRQIATVEDGAMLTTLGDLKNAFGTIATAITSEAEDLRERRS